MQGEIDLRGVTYIWSVFREVLTVTAPDGRQKISQLGSTTVPSLARLLARELADEHPTNE
jgi:hypothetical protein